MAVQAQYPSNVLIINRNVGVVEGKNEDCSWLLQSQQRPRGTTSSRFVDDSSPNRLFSDFPGDGNSRKRNRETNMNELMSILHQQQPHSQLAGVSTGLRLAFNDQQQLEQLSISSRSSIFSFLSEDLSMQFNQQKDEIEQFLHAQGEEFRRMLAMKRQMHYCALFREAEELVLRRMKEKKAEAEKAARHNAELEAREEKLGAEAQVWQARATALEAEAAALQSRLQEAIVSGRRGVCCLAQGEEVGLPCLGDEPEDAESAYIDPGRVVLPSGPGCKACGKRVASVLLLPCRHLCVCTECDGVVLACPLCLSFRTSSIEVYLS